jgi:hypothetical protein
MVTTPKDKNACSRGDYANVNPRPASEFYPEGSTPALTKEYGTKNDAELTNGYVPQVRKT